MSVILKRMGTEAVSVEPFGGFDGQGAPSYDSAVDIEARVVREDALVIDSDGSQVRTSLTVYVDAGQSPLPNHKDRLTVDDAEYVVRERMERRRLSGDVDHVRLRCREE